MNWTFIQEESRWVASSKDGTKSAVILEVHVPQLKEIFIAGTAIAIHNGRVVTRGNLTATFRDMDYVKGYLEGILTSVPSEMKVVIREAPLKPLSDTLLM